MSETNKDAIAKTKKQNKDRGIKGKEARLRVRKTKVENKAMNFPGEKQVSQKKSEKLLDRGEKIGNKIREIRNKKNNNPVNYKKMNKEANFYMMPGEREKDTPGTFRDNPINKYMSAVNSGHSPMEKHIAGHEEKKDEGIKLSVDTPSGPKAPRGPQSGKVLGVPVKIQTKGRSTKNTDLLEEGKKAYRKIKSYFSS